VSETAAVAKARSLNIQQSEMSTWKLINSSRKPGLRTPDHRPLTPDPGLPESRLPVRSHHRAGSSMLIFQSKLRQLQASGISSNIILATVHQLFGLGQICLFARLPPGQLASLPPRVARLINIYKRRAPNLSPQRFRGWKVNCQMTQLMPRQSEKGRRNTPTRPSPN